MKYEGCEMLKKKIVQYAIFLAVGLMVQACAAPKPSKEPVLAHGGADEAAKLSEPNF